MRKKLKQTKSKILVLAVLSLMVLSSLFTVSGSYAYWSSNVSNASTNAITTVTIGEWNQVFEWDSSTTYEPGDIVERNGTLYEATSSFWSNLTTPGSGWFWQFGWNVL